MSKKVFVENEKTKLLFRNLQRAKNEKSDYVNVLKRVLEGCTSTTPSLGRFGKADPLFALETKSHMPSSTNDLEAS